MSQVASEILSAAQTVDPSSIAVQAAEAAVTTAVDPTPSALISDFALAMQLVAEFKAKIAGMHPTISTIVKALF